MAVHQLLLQRLQPRSTTDIIAYLLYLAGFVTLFFTSTPLQVFLFFFLTGVFIQAGVRLRKLGIPFVAGIGSVLLMAGHSSWGDAFSHLLIDLELAVSNTTYGLFGWTGIFSYRQMDLVFTQVEPFWYFLFVTGLIGGSAALFAYKYIGKITMPILQGPLRMPRPVAKEFHLAGSSLFGGYVKSWAYFKVIREGVLLEWTIHIPLLGIEGSFTTSEAAVTFAIFTLLHGFVYWTILLVGRVKKKDGAASTY